MNTAIANKIVCRSHARVEVGNSNLKHCFVKLVKAIYRVVLFDAEGIFTSKYWPYLWDKKDNGLTCRLD
jgi:hypothetical protein